MNFRECIRGGSLVQAVAQRQHRSISQYVTIVLRRHLQEHGELPEVKA